METKSIDSLCVSHSKIDVEILNAIDECHPGLLNKLDEQNYFSHLGKATAKRVLVGYYVKGDLRIAFYDTVPSWWSRMKMYWIFGWKWESYKDVLRREIKRVVDETFEKFNQK